MSAFRRLSFVGGSSDDTEEDRRPYQHRHSHLHRRKKDYSISPTGGNRPVSITSDPRVAASPPSLSEKSSSSRLRRSHTSKPDLAGEVRRHKSRSDKESSSSSSSRKHRSKTDSSSRAGNEKEGRRHKSRSELSSTAPARENSSRHSNSHSHSSRSDSPGRKHSSRKHRSERSETALVEDHRAAAPSAPIAVPSAPIAVPSAPIAVPSAPVAVPMQAQMSEPLQMPEPFQHFPISDPLQIRDMSNTLSNSPPSSGSSMGIIISGNRNRSGSTPSTPMITATPPTPSPFEQARRANTHPSFSTPASPGFSRTSSIPPPYPQTPPISSGELSGQDYINYAVSKIGIGKPDQNSLLHRYRSNFEPRPGTFELSSEPEPIEIGSSDHGTIAQPQRQDSGKSFSSSGNVNVNGPQLQRGFSGGHGSGHGEIHVKIKRHSATSSSTLSRRGLGRNSMRENQYDFLRSFDTVFIIDDSASMEAFTRWGDTRTALETIASIATKYDTDGIDIHFLNSTKHDARNVKSAAEVHRLFDLVQPGGITPIAACLDRILRDYLDSYAAARTTTTSGSPPMTPMSLGFNAAQYPKPLNIIILTDGEPTDDPESVIVDAARRLDMLNAPLHQVGIQFFQIGDEEGAREALEDLDDALVEIYGIRDMVDYTPYPNNHVKEGEDTEGGGVDGEWILKVLMGAVNRRLDRWENKPGR